MLRKTPVSLLFGALACCALWLPAQAQNAAPATIWIEGESALRTNLSSNPWMKGDNPKLLSEGDALGCLNKRTDLPNPGYILYKLAVPADGVYHFYMRHGYTGHMGQTRYRFIKLGADDKPVKKPGPDEGWIPFDLDTAVMDLTPIGQHRTIEWTRHDPVQLEKANYYLDIQILGPNPAKKEADAPVWTVIDAICLSSEPFTPAGFTKPGQKPAAGQAGGGGADYY